MFHYFSALNLETGKRSVMHLVARETLPEPATQGDSHVVTLSFHWFVASTVSVAIGGNDFFIGFDFLTDLYIHSFVISVAWGSLLNEYIKYWRPQLSQCSWSFNFRPQFHSNIFYLRFHQINFFNSGEKSFSSDKLYFWNPKNLNLVDFLRNLFPKRVKKRTIIAHQQYRSTDDLYYVS